MRVAWISAGVSSFIAAYISKPDVAVYVDVANQHPDSLRFVSECAAKLECPTLWLRDTTWGGEC